MLSYRYVMNVMFCWLALLLYLQRRFLFSIHPHSKSNDTENYNNETLLSTTPTVKPTTPALPTPKPILPVQTGVKAQEEEQSSGLTIFFSLLVIGWCYFCSWGLIFVSLLVFSQLVHHLCLVIYVERSG